jgi:hypothetical protein
LSDNIRKGIFATSDLNYEQALLYLRRERFSPPVVPEGWFLASFRGVNMGFCNNIGNRINNYYPLKQRIRMDLREAAGKHIISWNPE